MMKHGKLLDALLSVCLADGPLTVSQSFRSCHSPYFGPRKDIMSKKKRVSATTSKKTKDLHKQASVPGM